MGKRNSKPAADYIRRAWDLVLSDSVSKVLGIYKISATNTGRYTADLDLTSCSCTFFNNFGLPCRHLLFLSDRAEGYA